MTVADMPGALIAAGPALGLCGWSQRCDSFLHGLVEIYSEMRACPVQSCGKTFPCFPNQKSQERTGRGRRVEGPDGRRSDS